MRAPYDMERIIGGLTIFKAIDSDCEVRLGDGFMEAGPDMPPDVLNFDEVETLQKLGWVHSHDPVCSIWRLELK